MGKSVHRGLNTYGEIYFQVAFHFSTTFLEDCGLLHIEYELDIYAVQYTFLPMIQEKLDSFRLGWCHHSMRTEHNRTPMQLWVSGLLQTNRDIPQHAGTDAVSALLWAKI